MDADEFNEEAKKQLNQEGDQIPEEGYKNINFKQ